MPGRRRRRSAARRLPVVSVARASSLAECLHCWDREQGARNRGPDQPCSWFHVPVPGLRSGFALVNIRFLGYSAGQPLTTAAGLRKTRRDVRIATAARVLRLVDGGFGLRRADAAQRRAQPVLRRLCRPPARGVRLEQDSRRLRVLPPPPRERAPRPGRGLADRPLRPAGGDARRHGDLRRRPHVLQPDQQHPRALRGDLRHGRRFEPRRLSAGDGGGRQLVQEAAGHRAGDHPGRLRGRRPRHPDRRLLPRDLRLARDRIRLRRPRPLRWPRPRAGHPHDAGGVRHDAGRHPAG